MRERKDARRVAPPGRRAARMTEAAHCSVPSRAAPAVLPLRPKRVRQGFERTLTVPRIAFVVGVERLRLEGEEERPPFVARVFDEQRAVLVDAVVLFVRTRVALVHVDVVDA